MGISIDIGVGFWIGSWNDGRCHRSKEKGALEMHDTCEDWSEQGYKIGCGQGLFD